MRLKIIVSLICVILVGLHIAFPAIVVDYVTFVLLIVAATVWLAPLIKSLELPGGFKIELQDVKTATDKVSSGIKEREEPDAEAPTLNVSFEEEFTIERLRKIANSNPNVALVGLRIEIEKRLAEFAQSVEISTEHRTVGWLLRELQQRKMLSPATASGLNELVALGNQAAQGAVVTRDAVEWALDTAPTIFGMITAPHITFLNVCDKLDKLIFTCAGIPLRPHWDDKDYEDALNRLEERQFISSSERSEIDAINILSTDIQFGFGSWYEEAITRMPKLEKLIEVLKRRYERGEASVPPS